MKSLLTFIVGLSLATTCFAESKVSALKLLEKSGLSRRGLTTGFSRFVFVEVASWKNSANNGNTFYYVFKRWDISSPTNCLISVAVDSSGQLRDGEVSVNSSKRLQLIQQGNDIYLSDRKSTNVSDLVKKLESGANRLQPNFSFEIEEATELQAKKLLGALGSSNLNSGITLLKQAISVCQLIGY